MQKVIQRRYFFSDEITGALSEFFVSKGYKIVSVTNLGPNQLGGQDYLIIYEDGKENTSAAEYLKGRLSGIQETVEIITDARNAFPTTLDNAYDGRYTLPGRENYILDRLEKLIKSIKETMNG